MKYKILLTLALAFVVSMSAMSSNVMAQLTNPQGGSIGIEGVIPGEPPTQAATISVPGTGQAFGNIPITVSGICPADTVIKIYRNDVFSGSVVCNNGSYTLQIDLFEGRNELVARVFDALDQAGPDSNTVTVTYDTGQEDDGIDELLLTSNFSNRGANPGSELTWPLGLSGGLGPYALSIDWGDGTVEPLSLDSEGQFILRHVYNEPGVYNLIIKATDSQGDTAFIQLIAVANGTLNESIAGSGQGPGSGSIDPEIDTGQLRVRYVVWPIYVMIFAVVTTFWLGKRYEKRRIRQKLYYRDGVDL